MVTRLAEVLLTELPSEAPATTQFDNETVWDQQTCDWVPRRILFERDRAKREAKRREAFRSNGCAVTDEVFEAIVGNTLGDTQALRELKAWGTQRDKPWVALSGPTGCGKSVAVASLMWGAGGRFVRADEAVRLFASMFGEQYEQQQKLRDAGLLVIDDVGGELDAARMLPVLLDLLDSRKSARSTPTVLTTNLTKKEFRERYANDRLMSRMAESVQWVALNGEDLRRKR
jgi:DNA replication protein DnaC